jgi:hypothetical protein
MPPRTAETSTANLVLDLQVLVDAGLLEFHDGPVGVRQYGLTERGKRLAAQRPARVEVAREAHDWSSLDSCPRCGSTAGFDAGARCRQCMVAAPPYM